MVVGTDTVQNEEKILTWNNGRIPTSWDTSWLFGEEVMILTEEVMLNDGSVFSDIIV